MLHSMLLDPVSELDLPTTLVAQARSFSAPAARTAAWPRAAVLEILPYLRKRSIAVLGGDVVRLSEGEGSYTHDNWHTEPAHGEAFADYARRSIEATEQYITRYSEPGPGHYYILLLADHLG
jgi:Immunity protein 40